MNPGGEQRPANGSNPATRVGEPMADWMREVVPFGIFTTDVDLRVTGWNPWLAAHSGLAPAAVIGRRLPEVFPDLESRRLTERYAQALAGEISVLSTALHRYLLSFPSTVPESLLPHMLQTVRIAPLPRDDRIIGTITIIEDVTQREFQAAILSRQQELDRLLSAALAALLQSEDPAGEIAAIFASIRFALSLDIFVCYLVEPDQRGLLLHSATGISASQREAIQRVPLNETELAEIRGSVLPAAAGPAWLTSRLQEMKVNTRLGFPLAVNDRVLGLVIFGSYARVASSPADLGVLARIARYVAIALDRAQRERETAAASRAKDDFLAALSHELRTPLNPVLLVASDSVANDAYPPAAREAFRVIEKNALLEARLIDDLLDLTRIAHGKLGLEMQPLSVHAALRDAVGTALTDMTDRGLRIRMELAGVEPRVMGDSGRLQQVFWNVVKNAVKFSPDGGEITVKSMIDSAEREIAIEVADSGIGMDAAELGRVFSAFTQGDHAEHGRSHRFGGLGLGLAISRKLLEMHSGRIEAHSAGKGLGSTFVIFLPLLSAGPATLPPIPGVDPEAAPPANSVSPFRAARRILLVEDHDPTRATLARLLTRRGYDVTSVSSAHAACEVAGAAHFDLVLSDIGLPDRDGFSLMRWLRTEYGLRGIALTGYGMEEDLARSTDAGFFAHLTKPISANVLDRSLERVFAEE